MEVNNSTYFNFHKNKEKNPHYFLCEELLVPFTSNCDTQRLNMFANHINQLVHLKQPEFPRVFTNFEDQIGEYSIAYKKAKKDFTVIRKIIKNQFNYDLLVQYDDGIFDILHFRTAGNTTESYGYKMVDCIGIAKEGSKIKKDQFLYRSTNYDEDGNFSYGTNLRAVYTSKDLKTYEDGIVISESAAKKLTSYKTEKTAFSVNTNDVLLNLYGDEYNFKSFPHVGDHIDSEVLVASRRRNKFSILYDFQNSNLRKIDNVNDDVIYTKGGTVVDINVYNNVPLEVLRERNDQFSKEILTVVEDQYRYWEEIAEATELVIPVIDHTEDPEGRVMAYADLANFGYEMDHGVEPSKNPNKYTDEVGYYWKLSHEILNENIKWRFDGNQFDNMRIEFTILKENPLVMGSKITGRYGNKGICASIVPDEEMPITEDGVRAEICLNALGKDIAQIKTY